MTRSRISSSLHSLDLKIDKTLNRLRKTKNIHVGNSSSGFNSISESHACESKPDIVDNPLYELEPMENNNKTLKELVTLDVLYQPSCIQYPHLVGEDPHKHLKEFHVVCSTMRLQGIPNDYIKMKVFLFSLDWSNKGLAVLATSHVQHLGYMKRMFLEKFFPTSRTVTIRKEIYRIRQHSGKTLHKYLEKFNKLCAKCPHHQISQ
ncbi:hypothetical protein CR513_58355, partial [Mucuna pruriens]